MKRHIAILLAVLMLVVMIGCQNNKTGMTQTSVQASNEAYGEGENVTVLDDSKCRITIIGMERDPYFGNTVKVMLENKTIAQTLNFIVPQSSVNGIEWNTVFAKEVPPLSKKTENIQFVGSLADEITEYTAFELVFKVTDADYKELSLVPFRYYPIGKDNAKAYTRQAQPSDVVIRDNDILRLTVIGYDVDDVWGGGVNLFMENKSNDAFRIGVTGVLVNGHPCDPFWATTVRGKTAAYKNIYFLSDDFTQFGITEMESIEMTFHVYNSETNALLCEWTVTLNP